MKEVERQQIIDNINRNMNLENSLVDMFEKLNELSNDPKVVEYLNLLLKVGQTEKEISFNQHKGINSLEDMVKYQFRNTTFSCEHNIWIYKDSVYYVNNSNALHFYNEDEEVANGFFGHNEYVCLECGMKLDVKDYRTFEKKHKVLKLDNKQIDIDYYRNLYYQLLYNNYSFEEANKKIIEIFNEDMKSKAKIKRHLI